MADNSKMTFDKAADELNKREDLSDSQKDYIYGLMEKARDSATSADAVDWKQFLSVNAPTLDERISATVNRDHDVSPMFSLQNIQKNPELLYSKGDGYWRKWDDNTMADAAIKYGYLPADLRWPTGNAEYDRIRDEQLKAFHDDAVKYEADWIRRGSEEQLRQQREGLARDLEKNRGDILHPIESIKGLFDSDDWIGYFQNTVAATMYPTAYRLTQEYLNGNTSITEDDVRKAALTDYGINVVTAPLGGEISGMKALRGAAGLRTKSGELIGDAVAGAIGGGSQEIAAEGLSGGDFSPGDIATASLFGAGGNAGVKGATMLGTGAIGAYTGIKGGKGVTRLKGTQDWLNDAAYSEQAVEGSRLGELNKSVERPIAETRAQLDKRLENEHSAVRSDALMDASAGDNPKELWGDVLLDDAHARRDDVAARVRSLEKKFKTKTPAYEEATAELAEADKHLANVQATVSGLPDKAQWSKMMPEERLKMLNDVRGQYGDFWVPEKYSKKMKKADNLVSRKSIYTEQANPTSFSEINESVESGANPNAVDVGLENAYAEQILEGYNPMEIFGTTNMARKDIPGLGDYAISQLSGDKYAQLRKFGAEREAEMEGARKAANYIGKMEKLFNFEGLPDPITLAQPNPAPFINMVTGLVERSQTDADSDEELKEIRFQNGQPRAGEDDEYRQWQYGRWANGDVTFDEQHSPEYQEWFIRNQFGVK